MADITLIEWQTEAIESLRNLIRSGVRNIMLYSPTGAGKTILATYMIKGSMSLGKRAVFCCDRITLIDQTSITFDKYGVDNHGVMQADHWRNIPDAPVQVCSAQTLVRRKFPPADLIVVDEAHTMYKSISDRIERRDTITIGLSASPFTKGLKRYYDAVVSTTTTNKLIEQGRLSRYRVFAASEPDMKGVKVVAGEWVDKEASSRAMKVVGDCVSEYIKHAFGRKFIAFGCDVAHCEEIARQFNAAGVPTHVYTYREDSEHKAEILNEVRKKNPSILGLVSVSALAKGLDIPDISCVILARPLKSSFSEHIQMVGRGLRAADGKDDCIILDHAGNTLRFYDEMMELYENGVTELPDHKAKKKDKKKKEGEEKVMKCPKCHAVHKPMPKCPECGFDYPKRLSSIVHENGKLKEFLVGGTTIAEVHQWLWKQIYTYGAPRGWSTKRMYATYFDMSGQKGTSNPILPTDAKVSEPVPLDAKFLEAVNRAQKAYFTRMRYAKRGK